MGEMKWVGGQAWKCGSLIHKKEAMTRQTGRVRPSRKGSTARQDGTVVVYHKSASKVRT